MISGFFRHRSENNYYGTFLFLYAVAICINYFTPGLVRYSFFSLLLLLFLRSKDNAFWIAFFWCLIYAPGYLFHATDPNFSLPFVGVPGSGREVAYSEIIITLILL
jgi:hypothetical protein